MKKIFRSNRAFNSAKYFSFKNDNDAISENEIHVVFPKNYLDGVYQIDPYTNTPIDVGIYSHPNLFTSSIPTNFVICTLQYSS